MDRYEKDVATERRIMETRVEALRKVSDFVLKTQEHSYNEARENEEDDIHIYLYALTLNAWLEELLQCTQECTQAIPHGPTNPTDSAPT